MPTAKVNGVDIEFEAGMTVLQVAELALFVFVMVFVLGRTGRRLFKWLGRTDEASFVLMLGIVGIGAALAAALHLEGILGAFLAGIAVNEAVRDTSAKEKIEFLGNVFFILLHRHRLPGRPQAHLDLWISPPRRGRRWADGLEMVPRNCGRA
jgi:Kef-type K+ transport system membrane component KefB